MKSVCARGDDLLVKVALAVTGGRDHTQVAAFYRAGKLVREERIKFGDFWERASVADSQKLVIFRNRGIL